MTMLRITIILVLCIGYLHAAVDGSPLTLQPGPQPDIWMEVGNDNFITDQPDDNLTAQWKGGFSTDTFAMGFSYDMLTEKNLVGSSFLGTREDEFTLVIGPRAFHITTFGQAITIQSSVGIVCDGNIGGRVAQNEFHRYINNMPIQSIYDNNTVHIKEIVLEDVRDRVWIAGPFFIEGQCQAETNIQWGKISLAVLPMYVYHKFVAFAGPTFQSSWGSLSKTSGIVDKKYDHVGLLAGLRVDYFYFTVTFDKNHIGNGCFGFETHL